MNKTLSAVTDLSDVNPAATETVVDPSERTGVHVCPLPGSQPEDEASIEAAPMAPATPDDAEATLAEPAEPEMSGDAPESPAPPAAPTASPDQPDTELDWERKPHQLTTVAVASLTVDPDIQCRIRLDKRQVEEYANRMAAGDTFPPLVVFDDGERWYVVDGWHRLEACKQLGRSQIKVKLYQGNRSQALLCAAGANAEHGLRRSNAEKRRAIKKVLGDPQWQRKADNWIARRLRVDGKTVGKVRHELETTSEIPKSAIRQTADGREMDVAAIGGVPEVADPLDTWLKSLRQALKQSKRTQHRNGLVQRFGEDQTDELLESLEAPATLLEELCAAESDDKQKMAA